MESAAGDSIPDFPVLPAFPPEACQWKSLIGLKVNLMVFVFIVSKEA